MCGRCRILKLETQLRRSREQLAISATWRLPLRTGTPDTTMYASPIVSTFWGKRARGLLCLQDGQFPVFCPNMNVQSNLGASRTVITAQETTYRRGFGVKIWNNSRVQMPGYVASSWTRLELSFLFWWEVPPEFAIEDLGIWHPKQIKWQVSCGVCPSLLL